MTPVAPDGADTEDQARVEDAVRAIEETGWAVLPSAVPASTVARWRAAVDRSMDAAHAEFGPNDFLGVRTRRLFNLLAHDPVLAEVPLHPTVLRVVERALDREPLLSSLTAVETHPGQDPQPLHADDGSIPLQRPHQPLALVALWALTDFTAENGATRVVPGSHRRDRRPRSGEVAETRPVVMPAGSVLLYNGSLWHGGGANRSQGPRVFVVANYCVGWMRQEESQLLAVPRERVTEFPERLRNLLGYGVYRGLLGHVAGEDPGTWFGDASTGPPARNAGLVWDRMR